MLKSLFRKKPVTHYASDTPLLRSLTTSDLIFMGIGAIIGAGVFVLTGVAAATQSGPAIILSYVLAGAAAMFAALSYAELASSIGGSGSAYSYAYAGFGEFIAWIIAWNLLLEYAMSLAAVAIGWSGYVNNFFQAIHIELPRTLTTNYFNGGGINLLAVFIIWALAILLCLGVKHSARFNTVIVLIKLFTILVFITVAAFNVNINNWHDFMPYGWSGVMSGAALVFFAYIGFDALSTTVEETITPQRSIPIGIVVSLIICTLIYMIVAGLLTLIVPYSTLDVRSPVAQALLSLGYHFAAGVIAAGAIAGLTTVMLVMYYGFTRICLAISRDGLIPGSLGKINMHTRSPVRLILIIGFVMGIIAGFTPIDRAAELVNIGTLTAFIFVCGGVIVFRYTHPNLTRPFRLPFNPIFPALGILLCLILMVSLSSVTWWRFVIWSVIGIVIYFFYSYKHSVLAHVNNQPAKVINDPPELN